jgi:hypothetical protein
MSESEKEEIGLIAKQLLKEITKISENLASIETLLQNLTGDSEELSKIFTNIPLNNKPLADQSMPSSLEILDLQDKRPGIFKTYKVLQKKGDWVKSSEIAAETERSRGLESRYLNFLSEKGFVLKKREKLDAESRVTEVWYKILGVND